MSTRLHQILTNKKQQKKKCLSIFLTAGFPEKNDTTDLILVLADAGVDFIELGIPFSDPIADGPVIQKASDIALSNGMNLKQVLNIVAEVRKSSRIPIILMGYLNPIYQLGLPRLIDEAGSVGVDGLILPDWPLEESQHYRGELEKAELDLIHLVAPNTPIERIRQIDELSSAFIYCVAYTGVTGQDNRPTPATIAFFEEMNRTLRHPWLIGFGVKNHQDFQTYTQFADGVIIGSAFLQLLENTPAVKRIAACRPFIHEIINPATDGA
ncbi:MAG: tryptophan synthase subunit alpha [Candidatus Marinimicrobia bacterium]|jgi:tryptophan synthase alpha chain|nr:tryptophan synthase subunit alpha [Candidatus Neomarinimicrobiota bacterium]MCK9483559.1 tryptophan synthase subunit alpha [Candidatus Neomarinimicrobiota bacterium]MDD5061489.1 tryptophan synthase subunit alpha [Candidatus Neomarinimicrobiota bacterium]